ncbi:MAG TPA: VanZ family protein [Candidatus Eisenbacteria bacterium]|nr:VanZ family protein [Candidatus Eisenbacteria bacterium]
MGGRALFLRYWLPVLLYVLLIFTLSSLPGPKIPGPFRWMDKLVHMLEYSLFGLLVGRAIRFTMIGGGRAAVSIAAIAFGAGVALLDELYQSLIPGRHSDPFDWLVDVGAITAAVVATQVLSTRPLGRRAGGPEA